MRREVVTREPRGPSLELTEWRVIPRRRPCAVAVPAPGPAGPGFSADTEVPTASLLHLPAREHRLGGFLPLEGKKNQGHFLGHNQVSLSQSSPGVAPFAPHLNPNVESYRAEDLPTSPLPYLYIKRGARHDRATPARRAELSPPPAPTHCRSGNALCISPVLWSFFSSMS